MRRISVSIDGAYVTNPKELFITKIVLIKIE